MIMQQFLNNDKLHNMAALDALSNAIVATGVSKPPEVQHAFGGNVYVRSCKIEKGSFFTSRIQRLDHVVIMSSGHLKMWTPEKGLHDVVGFNIFEVKAGAMRAAYAYEDTFWANAYGIENPQAIAEDRLIDVVTYESYNDYIKSNSKGSVKCLGLAVS